MSAQALQDAIRERDEARYTVAWVRMSLDAAEARATEAVAIIRAMVDYQGRCANGFPLSENELREWAAANYNARAFIASLDARTKDGAR